MGGARARSRDANTQAPGKLGISRCHKRSHLLVPGLNELDFSIGAIEGAKHAVDAIAGITEGMAYTPVVKTLDEKITYSLGHGNSNYRRGAQPTNERREVFQLSPGAARSVSARSQRAVSASTARQRQGSLSGREDLRFRLTPGPRVQACLAWARLGLPVIAGRQLVAPASDW